MSDITNVKLLVNLGCKEMCDIKSIVDEIKNKTNKYIAILIKPDFLVKLEEECDSKIHGVLLANNIKKEFTFLGHDIYEAENIDDDYEILCFDNLLEKEIFTKGYLSYLQNKYKGRQLNGENKS